VTEPINANVSQSSLPFPVYGPSRGWLSLRLREVWDYRESLVFLTWRDIKVHYAQAAIHRLEYEFILIGLDYNGSILSSRICEAANIKWLGPKPYAEIHHYHKYFDVDTIPFELIKSPTLPRRSSFQVHDRREAHRHHRHA
jgi:hypothetical protein